MQIFQSIAGYSLGHADIVRRAISKKHADELMREKDAFIKGAGERGLSEGDAEKLFGDIADFANYAFNKSHAAAYAVTSYRTAYLKTHYNLEYNCALITSVLSSPEKISEYLSDCRKRGIAVLPPDVNKSRADFRGEDGSIRFGLGALRNVGVSFIERLVLEREENGLFSDFDDFLSRMEKHGLNKRQMEAFIKSGSLDSLGVYRSKMLAVYESLMEKTSSSQLEGQLDIFSAFSDEELEMPKTQFPNIPEFSTAEKLRMEKEVSGMFLSGHLLDDYSENVKALHPHKIVKILRSFHSDEEEKYKEGTNVCLCVSVASRVNKNTSGGDQMAFVTVEDGSASIEIVVFPKVLSEYGHLLTTDSIIAVTGKISAKDDEDPKILMTDGAFLSRNGNAPAYPKSMMPKPKVKDISQLKLYLRVPSIESSEFSRINAFLSIFNGSVPVVIYDSKTGKASALKGAGALVNDFTVSELSEILGEANVVIK